MVEKVFPDSESSHSLLMKIPVCTTSGFVMGLGTPDTLRILEYIGSRTPDTLRILEYI